DEGTDGRRSRVLFLQVLNGLDQADDDEDQHNSLITMHRPRAQLAVNEQTENGYPDYEGEQRLAGHISPVSCSRPSPEARRHLSEQLRGQASEGRPLGTCG